MCDTHVAAARVAVRVREHSHPISEQQTGFMYQVLRPSIFLFAALAIIYLLGFKGIALVWIASFFLALIKDPAGFLGRIREHRSKLPGKKAIIYSILDTVGAFVAAPHYTLWILWNSSTVKHLKERLKDTEAIHDSPFDSRVTCYGNPSELKQVIKLGDVPFEPVIVQHTHKNWSEIRSNVHVALGISVLIPALGIFLLITYLIGHLSTRLFVGYDITNTWFWPTAAGFIFMSAGIWALPRILRWGKPTYYRVMPGQVDTMEFNWLATKPRSVKKINLRDATVEVRYDQEEINIIKTASMPPEKLRISMEGMKERHRFAEAVILAALSSSPTPPLPDDALLG